MGGSSTSRHQGERFKKPRSNRGDPVTLHSRVPGAATLRLLRLLEALAAETAEDAAEWRSRMDGWARFHVLSPGHPVDD